MLHPSANLPDMVTLPLLQWICTYAQLVLVKHSLQSCIGAAFAARASMPVFSLAAVPCRAISLEV